MLSPQHAVAFMGVWREGPNFLALVSSLILSSFSILPASSTTASATMPATISELTSRVNPCNEFSQDA